MEIVNGENYLPEVKRLIKEYTGWLGRDLTFQNIEAELDDVAHKYTGSAGELLVAVDEKDTVLGMVAYHRHSDVRCEMKRLYVRPEARGKHLGNSLVKAIIDHAENAGYREMVLDTIKPFKATIALYQKHGFIECGAYYNNPMDDVIYMKKILV